MLIRFTSLIFGRRLPKTYRVFYYSTMADADKFQKLPTFAKPDRYRLHLKPDLNTFECPGRVEIDVRFSEKTNFVKLHSAVNELFKIDLTLENGKEWTNLKFNVDKKWKTATIEFGQEIEPQKAKLSIDFKAEISKHLRGFYRSVYKDKDGSTKYLASTQFESDSACYAYPCFDEPIYKAVFDIELEVDRKLTALSNMNIVEEKPTDGDKKLVKYATTPIMSTYLVAFIVGDFEYIETRYGKDNIPIRLYTLPGKTPQAHFSLMLAKRSMEWYEEWFDAKSPLPKVDLIAIPDFSMGAMENWLVIDVVIDTSVVISTKNLNVVCAGGNGSIFASVWNILWLFRGLVTFREIRLLVDESTSHRTKSLVGLVVAHELAHFWFGNLTTMTWWCDLWLKEGFASFMEYHFCEVNYPELKTAIDYLTDVQGAAFAEDSLQSSHKIEVEINDPAELTSIYDSITYDKSNSIIKMLFHYLGEEIFREGLRLYVKRFSYKNAVTNDLWQCWTDASKQDIKEIMSSWTQQMGYPLIKVEEERLPGNKRRLRLHQTRYLADGTTDESSLWQVPITIIRASDPEKPFYKFLMTECDQEVVIDVADNEWIKLNSASSGFYRVQYSDSMLKQLLGAVQAKHLTVLDRFGLASDLIALVKASKVSASQFFALFAASVNEDECIVWQSLVSGLKSFINVFDRNDPELKNRLDTFICNILEPVADKLGWSAESGEDPHRSQLRGLILGSLSKAKHSKTIEQALKLYDEYSNGRCTLHPDLRPIIFATLVRNNDTGTEQVLKIFENSDQLEIQRNALAASVQTNDPEVIKSVLDYAIVDGKARPQDWYLLFVACSMNGAKAQDIAYDYFKKNHAKLSELLGGPTEGVFQHCFEYSACGHSTEEVANDLGVFFNSTFDEEARNACNKVFAQSQESVLLNAKLYKDHKTSVAEFLSGSH